MKDEKFSPSFGACGVYVFFFCICVVNSLGIDEYVALDVLADGMYDYYFTYMIITSPGGSIYINPALRYFLFHEKNC